MILKSENLKKRLSVNRMPFLMMFCGKQAMKKKAAS